MVSTAKSDVQVVEVATGDAIGTSLVTVELIRQVLFLYITVSYVNQQIVAQN
jgi:hypothetical protein